MNKEEAKNIIPILQAFVDGRTIQYEIGYNEWKDLTTDNLPILTKGLKLRVKQ